MGRRADRDDSTGLAAQSFDCRKVENIVERRLSIRDRLRSRSRPQRLAVRSKRLEHPSRRPGNTS
jgi:hypothetical protein